MTLVTVWDAFMKIANIDSVEKDTESHLLEYFGNMTIKHFEEYF